nr:hypothetical protein HmN_000396700 [Hymenolepis microstoma]
MRVLTRFKVNSAVTADDARVHADEKYPLEIHVPLCKSTSIGVTLLLTTFIILREIVEFIKNALVYYDTRIPLRMSKEFRQLACMEVLDQQDFEYNFKVSKFILSLESGFTAFA